MAGTAQAALAPGAGAALITLFGDDGELLLDETADLAGRLVDAGAASILVAGTSGEFWALQDAERVALAAAVRQRVSQDVPVMGHVGGVPSDRAAALATAMAADGIDGVLALPLGVEADALASYYDEIVRAADVPVVAYHLPQAGATVGLDALRDLGVAAIKDSSGDGERLAEEVLDIEIETYTGAPTLLGLAHDLGAAGAMMGITNVRPEAARDAFAGDRDALRLLSTESAACSRNFPLGLKELTADRWGTPARLRQA
jgi:4-hydroxy-tetrahydrodipicolinate synthase